MQRHMEALESFQKANELLPNDKLIKTKIEQILTRLKDESVYTFLILN